MQQFRRVRLRTDGYTDPIGVGVLRKRAHEFHQHDLLLQRVEQRRHVGDVTPMGQVRRAGHIQFTGPFVVSHRLEHLRQPFKQRNGFPPRRLEGTDPFGSLCEGEPEAGSVHDGSHVGERDIRRLGRQGERMLCDVAGVGDDHDQQQRG